VKLLDLFCGAGGAAMGYHRAGFTVVGVDHRPQPRYPFRLVEADAIEYAGRLARRGHRFAAVHASPPCQHYSHLRRKLWAEAEHPDLLDATRAALVELGVPYVIENIQGAPLVEAVVLCGTSFGLRTRRHRYFEASFPILVPPCVHHGHRALEVHGHSGGTSRRSGARGRGTVADWREGLGIDWMTGDELTQAVPPVFTELIGHQLRRYLEAAA